MGEGLQVILDVTVVYPGGQPTLLDLFADRVGEVRVDVLERPIPRELASGDRQNDAAFRERFQAWVNALDRQGRYLRAARLGSRRRAGRLADGWIVRRGVFPMSRGGDHSSICPRRRSSAWRCTRCTRRA